MIFELLLTENCNINWFDFYCTETINFSDEEERNSEKSTKTFFIRTYHKVLF